MISTFCGYTTAHGLGRLADGGGVFRRIAWSLFCIGALTMFVVQTYNLFAIYLRRPVSTVVSVQHDSVSIWHVYICFTSPITELNELVKDSTIHDHPYKIVYFMLLWVRGESLQDVRTRLASKRDTQCRPSAIDISFRGKFGKHDFINNWSNTSKEIMQGLSENLFLRFCFVLFCFTFW